MSPVDWSQFTPLEPDPAQPSAAPPAPVDWSKFTPLSGEDANSVARPAPEPSFLGELGSKVHAGLIAGQRFVENAFDSVTGNEPVSDEVARGLGYASAQDYADHQRALRMSQSVRQERAVEQTSTSTEEGMRAMAEADKHGVGPALKAIFQHPRAAAMISAKSIGMAAPGMAAAGASGAAMPVVVGLNSAVTDYQSTLEDQLASKGVDLADPVQVRRALRDPALMQQTREFADKHAIPVTMMDVLTAGIAGRLVAAARTPMQAARAVAAETGTQMAGGAVGEAGGELNSEGRISSPTNVAMEAVGEAPTEIVEAPAGYREAVRDQQLRQQLHDIEQGRRSSTKIPTDLSTIHDDYQSLADTYGATVTSRTRTPEHNAAVGGVANSQHLRGTAWDYVVPEHNKAAFIADAIRRGYQPIDEGDHVHVQLPHGTRVEPTMGGVPQPGLPRQSTLPAPDLIAPEPSHMAENIVTEAMRSAREKRGMSPVPEAPVGGPAESTPAAPIPSRRIAEGLEQAKDALLEQVSQQSLATPVAPPTPQTMAPVAPPSQLSPTPVDANPPASAPLPAEPPLPSKSGPAPSAEQITPQQPAQEAPQAPPAPAATPVAPAAPAPVAAPPAQPVPGNPVGVTTLLSDSLRQALNRDPGMVRTLQTNPLNPQDQSRATAQLPPDSVREVALSAPQQAQLDQLGRVLGRKIVLIDITAPGQQFLNGLAADDHHIFINVRATKDAGYSLVGLAGHEFTHTLRRSGNRDLEQLIAFAKRQLNTQNPYVLRNAVGYAQLYGQRGYSAQQFGDVFTEEMVADLIGDIISDPQFWNELAQDNPGLFRRTLKRFITFLTNLAQRARKLGDDGAFREIEKVRAMAKQVLANHVAAVAHGAAPTAPITPASAPQASLNPMDVRREARDRVAERAAYHFFEAGDYHSAANEVSRVMDEYAAPVPIDTPEKRAFFADSSRKVNQRDKAGVFFHGTARQITAFRPKTGEAVFMAERASFTPGYAAASQHHVNYHERGDVIVDGKSMRAQREASKVGSVDWIVADILIGTNKPGMLSFGPQYALDELDTYVYLNDQFNIEPITPESWEIDEVRSQLEEMSQKWHEDAGYIRSAATSDHFGMQTYPLVTNVRKPFDFEEGSDRKRLIRELQGAFQTARKFGEALDQRHHFENWDQVDAVLRDKGSNWVLMEDQGGGIPQLLQEMGYDGYFVSEAGHKNLAVFDPKQIKSATANVGPFGTRPPTAEEAASLGMTLEEAIAAQKLGDIRLSLNSVLSNTFTNPLQSSGNLRRWIERWLVDEYRDLKEIQDDIARNVLGGPLPPGFDAHRNENLRHGAYQDARERAETRFIRPIAQSLSKAGASLDEFSRYLWWRHAPERDAYLRNNLDPNVQVAPDGLAGISPQDAQAAIAALDPRKRAAFERAAKFIDGMRKFTLDTLLSSGQITQDYHDALLRQYQHYVPLRGMPDGSESLNGVGRNTSNLSMNKNPIGPRAAGRKSEPSNIIEEMMRDMDKALVGVQQQRVLESVVRLIAANPDPSLWEVQPVHAQRKWVDGVLTVVQTNGEAKDQLTFMHRGIPVKIEIRHPELQRALLNLRGEPLPKFLRSVGRLTRWLSAVKTAWSPYFVLVNPVRDAQLATMGVGAEHGTQALEKMAEFYPHSWAALARDERRKVAPHNNPIVNKLQQYAREFASVGGKTGYTYVSDIREQNRKLRHLMDRYSQSKGWNDILAGNLDTKDAALLMRKGMQRISHLAEVANNMAENCTRLTVYAAMRERGMGVEDAAAYAKEVTVNFNRRGRLAHYLGPLYMFFNASVQGGARMVSLTKNRKFQAMMGSLLATSYTLALAQMFAAGDDDDGESRYDKAVSDQQAQRYLSIYAGNGKSLTIPIPYGPNIFTYTGYRLAKMTYALARGRETGNVAGDIAAQAAMSMSPIDPGKGVAAFLPEVARVPYQIAINKNDFGNPIAAQLDQHDRTNNPAYLKTGTKVAAPFRYMARVMSEWTGGNPYEGGFVNITGEHAQYAYEQAFGGMARLGSESWSLVENLLAGVDPEPSDVPLANVYFRGKGDKRHAGTYYDNLADYENTVADWKLAIANGDDRKLDEIIKHAPWVQGAELDAGTVEGRMAQQGSVMEAKRNIDRQMKSLRQQRDAIMAGTLAPPAGMTPRQAAADLDRQMAGLQQDFNYALNTGRGYLPARR